MTEINSQIKTKKIVILYIITFSVILLAFFYFGYIWKFSKEIHYTSIFYKENRIFLNARTWDLIKINFNDSINLDITLSSAKLKGKLVGPTEFVPNYTPIAIHIGNESNITDTLIQQAVTGRKLRLIGTSKRLIDLVFL